MMTITMIAPMYSAGVIVRSGLTYMSALFSRGFIRFSPATYRMSFIKRGFRGLLNKKGSSDAKAIAVADTVSNDLPVPTTANETALSPTMTPTMTTITAADIVTPRGDTGEENQDPSDDFEGKRHRRRDARREKRYSNMAAGEVDTVDEGVLVLQRILREERSVFVRVDPDAPASELIAFERFLVQNPTRFHFRHVRGGYIVYRIETRLKQRYGPAAPPGVSEKSPGVWGAGIETKKGILYGKEGVQLAN